MTINGVEYDLKYNIGRMEQIEQITGKSTLLAIKNSGGMLSLSDLKVYFAYGLKESGSDIFYPIKKGMQTAQELIETKGYPFVCAAVLEALERDCPFFFREG